ncbi:TonB-dependent receptor [Pelagicoccus sp. SDUM812002]|uniref:TonB-dependent receptor n=1 Tax=Pelagicoccus sp. SDUM812002 TaxID=3041266 RepID=UPI00280CE41A|nr:TonB-dependent receptor [Pelagicoccus sp. SDUM812002]MDQ8184860.1 TonB-dependent receptor [Pelagicoccus sp. SDUM812002]
MSLNSRNTKSNWGLAKLLLVTIAVALFSNLALAQEANGVISGSVVDAEFGGGVSGVRVSVLDSSSSAMTDMNGRFLITGLPAGQYTLIATGTYYKSSRIEDLAVSAGSMARVDIPLYSDESEIVELDSFVVKAESLVGSDLALQSRRQAAPAASDFIGAEKFSQFGISDAADALGKVTGVSITDGKYIVVRGLSDRYNSTTMNGATVPSADPDKRAVQLDQFPSGMIESIETVKTFTPDKSGNFTGGYVDIKTKSVPDEAFMTLSLGVSMNEKTTFEDVFLGHGSSDDWKGGDSGYRGVPDIASRLEEITESPRRLNEEQRMLLSDITRSFSPYMTGQEEKSPLNHSASVSYGNRYTLGEGADAPTIGVVGSISNKRSFSYYGDGQVGRWELNPSGLVSDAEFAERKGTETNEWGTMLNIAFRPNSYHEIGINTSYTRSGDDEAISREGSRQASGSALFRVQNLRYTERSMQSGQLYGEHKFENLGGTFINWFVSDSESTQAEPDFRLFYDEIPESSFPVYRGNFPAPRRYWRDLEEATAEYKIDVAVPLGRDGSQIKSGVQETVTDRTFNEEAFIYEDNSRGFPSTYRYDGDILGFLDDSVLGLNPETDQVQRYISKTVGAVPVYSGEQTIKGAYIMGDLRVREKWRFILGARYEDTDIQVQSLNFRYEENEDDGFIEESTWLPSLNVVYDLSPSSKLRLAATQTLARPNFRELSPFGSFNNIGGETFVGNPELLMSDIDNLDIRWETFGKDGNLFAASVFAKTINNPIEQNYIDGELTYVNVDTAELKGLELEVRKRINFLSGESRAVTIGGNLSYTDSKVKRSEFEYRQKSVSGLLDVDPVRSLQGQAEWVGNADIAYEHFEKGSMVTLAYNYTGERMYSVSLGPLPDTFEAPSGDLDLIYSQKLSERVKMKLAFKNLLDESERKFLAHDGTEVVYSEYGKGLTASLSFSYDFH